MFTTYDHNKIDNVKENTFLVKIFENDSTRFVIYFAIYSNEEQLSIKFFIEC